MKFFAFIAGIIGSAISVAAAGSDSKARCVRLEECTPIKGGCFNLTMGQFVVGTDDKVSCGCI
ncbi:hypothetical protein BDV41DRAFT_141275 [Aspergillus transmontanensis]|uniref:Uncharacterized protein n=1 Tax=Aspergillus transmontanensis TaxID=1034304 RepID=A0A5N6W912_9EURO|nr:hypothetical protein BDV41DRAFT_141275 [Aspergillus transmontanensis]